MNAGHLEIVCDVFSNTATCIRTSRDSSPCENARHSWSCCSTLYFLIGSIKTGCDNFILGWRLVTVPCSIFYSNSSRHHVVTFYGLKESQFTWSQLMQVMLSGWIIVVLCLSGLGFRFNFSKCSNILDDALVNCRSFQAYSHNLEPLNASGAQSADRQYD